MKFAPILFALSALVFAGCGNKATYSQKSPDAVVRTARLMVENGDVAKLPDLIYAHETDMRLVLNRLGVLLGDLQELATELQNRFPDEVDELKTQAEEAAARGESSSIFGLLGNVMGGPQGAMAARRRPGRPDISPNAGRQMEQQFGNSLTALFADPFGFLRNAEAFLSTVEVDDETYAVLWDDQPVLAPIGLLIRKDAADGKWYIVPPTELPQVKEFMPKSREEYAVLAYLIKTVNMAVKDMTVDVRNGRLKNLEDVSRMAGEKAAIPAIMVFYAYQNLLRLRESAPGAAPRTSAPGVRIGGG